MGKLDDKLAEMAVALSYSPENPRLFDIFEDLYHAQGPEMEVDEYEFLYLLLRCINYPLAENYGKAAEYFLEKEQNGFLCFLCDLAALRLNPVDKKTYKRAAVFARRFIDKDGEAIETQGENECAVTVIMPTYNRGGVIGESIKSVLEQDFEDFELVIVNDGGDDRVKSVVDDLGDDRIRYIKIEHSGLAGALSAGLREARGEYVAYLDDDDVYYKDHLSTLVRIARDGDRGFVYSKSRLVRGLRDDSGNFIPRKDMGTYTLPYSRTTLATNLGISVMNVLHKRSLVKKVGLFNVDLPWSMDWDYWMRMSEVEAPYFVDAWTSEYRVGPDNMTTKKFYQSIFYMYHLLIPYFSTGYGTLTLYRSAVLQREDEKEFWSGRLPHYFISQEELFKTVFSSRRFIFDGELMRGALFGNKYRSEFSIKVLAVQAFRWAIS